MRQTPAILLALACLVSTVGLAQKGNSTQDPKEMKQVVKSTDKLSKSTDNLSDAVDKLTGTVRTSTSALTDAAGKIQDSVTKLDSKAQQLKAIETKQPKWIKAKGKAKPLGDFVPCLFDEDEAFSFRHPGMAEPEPTIDQEAAERWTQSVNSLASEKIGVDNVINQTEIENKTRSSAFQITTTAIDNANSNKPPSEKKELKEEVKALLNGTAPFEAPKDVSCSISLLGWHETNDDFGRRVANSYVGLQVTVRNLSNTSEFLIHDIQVAVDTGTNTDRFSRFQAARDKLIVRAVAQRGQFEDRRNLILNSMILGGSIAAGASTAVTSAFTDAGSAVNLSTAVAIFQGTFLSGFTNVFPDHTIEHINHISDMVFSASSNSKTIVPVQGAVPLVTFINERPLEQMPFARCGRKDFVEATLDHKSNVPGTRPICSPDKEVDFSSMSSYPAPLGYKKWEAAALQILKERLYVVVGGVHIQEDRSGNVAFGTLDCPKFPDGSIDLSSVTAGKFTCTITGSHLDAVKTAALRSAGTPVSGTFTSDANGSTASIQFAASDLDSLSGKYVVAFEDANSKDLSTANSISFSIREPSLTALEDQTAHTFLGKTIDSSKDLVVVARGDNPDRLASLTMTGADATTVAVAPIQSVAILATHPSGNTGTASFTFVAADLQKIKAAAGTGTITLAGKSKDQKSISLPIKAVTFQ